MNSRFSIAVHILTLLATTQDRVTSEFLAMSIGTNPVVIRRALAALREAGLVVSQSGKDGGWKLTRKPQTIRLSELRAALGDQAAFTMHRNEPHPNCQVGLHVRDALQVVYDDVDATIDKRLSRWTLADVLKDALSRG